MALWGIDHRWLLLVHRQAVVIPNSRRGVLPVKGDEAQENRQETNNEHGPDVLVVLEGLSRVVGTGTREAIVPELNGSPNEQGSLNSIADSLKNGRSLSESGAPEAAVDSVVVRDALAVHAVADDEHRADKKRVEDKQTAGSQHPSC